MTVRCDQRPDRSAAVCRLVPRAAAITTHESRSHTDQCWRPSPIKLPLRLCPGRRAREPQSRHTTTMAGSGRGACARHLQTRAASRAKTHPRASCGCGLVPRAHRCGDALSTYRSHRPRYLRCRPAQRHPSASGPVGRAPPGWRQRTPARAMGDGPERKRPSRVMARQVALASSIVGAWTASNSRGPAATGGCRYGFGSAW